LRVLVNTKYGQISLHEELVKADRRAANAAVVQGAGLEVAVLSTYMDTANMALQ
jgi:hypothetical protein